jgi:hypothetical protein
MAKNAANAIVVIFMLASFKNGRGRLNRRSLGWFLISARASMMRDELASVSRCRDIRMQGMPSVQYADPARRRWTRSETRRALTAHATASSKLAELPKARGLSMVVNGGKPRFGDRTDRMRRVADLLGADSEVQERPCVSNDGAVPAVYSSSAIGRS